jgi:hypothetical protein
MDIFTERLPYDSLATRRLALEAGRLVIRFKNLARSFEDEYDYRKIDPVFKIVRRGETEWSNTVFGLVIVSIVFFILTKMSSSLVFNGIVLSVQLCTALIAVFLIALIFIKKDHLYIMDTSGDCFLTLKSTPKSREFAAKLKAKVESAGAVK